MTKTMEYVKTLRGLDDWDSYLLQASGLPGPRANLELADAVANEDDSRLFQRYISYGVNEAPANSPYEFLAFCGVLGLGRLLAGGDQSQLVTLSQFAGDPRWRVREAVAMALQKLGDVNMDILVNEMHTWSNGTYLEQRAAVAALCEPRLLTQAEHVKSVLQLLNTITTTIAQAENRYNEDFLVLRKGLGYCWSVAVVSLPDSGKACMELWLVNAENDKDIRWIMLENLKKTRLMRMDMNWVTHWRNRLGGKVV